jgi:transmembrane sensor
MSTVDKDIREQQASYWARRMHESSDPLSVEERMEFEKWIADPRNERDFRLSTLIIAMAPDLAATDRARWVDEFTSATDGRVHSRRQLVRYWALAASLLALLVLGGFYAQSQSWFGGKSYLTHTGETLNVTLPEGSVAYLNTRTDLRWSGTDKDRRVDMGEGEALFDVVHDSNRPFRVVLGNSEIRVLGTRFNIYRRPTGSTTVTVLEGKVEVRGFGNGGSGQPEWTRTLEANEQIDYSSLGLVHEPHATLAQDSVHWRTGYYRFENQPVETVLDELTRYTDQHIVIRDPRIAELRINGSLKTHDIRDSLRRLQGLAPNIEVKENNNTFTLDYRAQAGRGKD